MIKLQDFPYYEEDEKVKSRDLKKLIASDNICELLDDDELKKISDTVIKELDIDQNDESRIEKMRKWKEGMDLAKQKIEAKNTPWVNAFNVKYPILTNAAIQFSARAYPAIVSATGIVKKKVIGRAVKQIQGGQAYGAPALPAPNAGMLQAEPGGASGAEGSGSVPQQMMQQQVAPRSKDQTASDAVEYMNYQLTCEMVEWLPDTDKLLQQLSLYGAMYRKIWYSKIKGRMCSKILTPLQFILPANISEVSESPRSSELFTLYPNEIESNVRSGIFREIENAHWAVNEDSEHPEEFVEQHRLLDLDGDGYKEPYIVTVHISSRETVRIKANYDESSIYSEDKLIGRIDKDQYYVEYAFIPSLDGTSYCTGFFDLAFHINQVINSVLNQLLDAGALANSGGGFVSKDLNMERGPMRFNIGEYKAVNTLGKDIREGLVPLNFPGANPVLFNLLEFLLNAAREITNVKDILLDSQRTNTPATTTMAIIEQGTKVYNGIFKRIHHALGKEFKLLKKLNAKYLKPNVYLSVIDAQVSPDDFKDESLDFEPVSDPETSSDLQRMAQAQFLQSFMVDPLMDPIKVRLRILSAAKIESPEELLAPPNPNPQPPPEIMIEMQKLQLQAQQNQAKIAEMEAKLQIEDQKIQLQRDQTAAQVLKLRSAAIADLANAESKEVGAQVQQYEMQLGQMNANLDRQHDMQRQRSDQQHQMNQQQMEQQHAREQQQQQLAADQQGRADELAAKQSNQSTV